MEILEKGAYFIQLTSSSWVQHILQLIDVMFKEGKRSHHQNVQRA